MPRIFDNIEERLLDALLASLENADRADFCVGYFNLRGWRQLDSRIEQWSGEDNACCRLLVGMQRPPEEELRSFFSSANTIDELDNQTAARMKRRLAQEFRDQISLGVPTNEDEAGLRRLANQIRTRKVRVKLFLRYPLHAKLYLLFRNDFNNPITGFVGSSNLSLLDLVRQGVPIATACAASGIHASTYFRWMRDERRPYREFCARVKKARAEAECRAVGVVTQAASKTWQAAAWRLERSYPERCCGRDRVGVIFRI